MEDRHIKIILALLILFLADITKPFGYSFSVELIFLAVIFVAMNFSLFVSFLISVALGYLKDCLSLSQIPLNLIEFPLITLLIYYFLSHFHKVEAKIFIVALSLLIHVILQSLTLSGNFLLFSLIFFIQSGVIFIALNYLLRKWLKILHESYI